jgi:hypothetical protein
LNFNNYFIIELYYNKDKNEGVKGGMERFQTVPYNWIPAFAGMTRGSGSEDPDYVLNVKCESKSSKVNGRPDPNLSLAA